MHRTACYTRFAGILWLACAAAACLSDESSSELDAGEDAATGSAASSSYPSAAAGLDASSASQSVARGASIHGAEIETVTIEARNVSTGIITLKEPYPVLLLRDGSACLDINFVAQGEDVATHRAKNPGRWLSWKRENGRIALLWSNGWFDVYFGGELPPEPRGFKLEGAYTYAKSFSIGTTVSVTEQSFVFSAEGRFVFASEKVFSAGDLLAGNGVFGGSFAPDQRGTYEVDGYLIRLQYDSGASVVTSFVHQGKTIYIGGTWYSMD